MIDVLFCVMLCYAMIRYATICYVVICYAMLGYGIYIYVFIYSRLWPGKMVAWRKAGRSLKGFGFVPEVTACALTVGWGPSGPGPNGPASAR